MQWMDLTVIFLDFYINSNLKFMKKLKCIKTLEIELEPLKIKNTTILMHNEKIYSKF